MNNLAETPGDQGKYEQAEEMHQQALRLRETVLSKERSSTLASMNNLALLLNRQGKYERVEEMPRLSAEPKKKRKGLFRYRSSLMEKCPRRISDSWRS
jgi:hypothetical protein